MFNPFATGDTQPPTAGLQDAPEPGPASGASTARGAAESDDSNLGSDVGSISRHPSTVLDILISEYPGHLALDGCLCASSEALNASTHVYL